jgi:RND family efflux transporter MFP subunit
MKTEALARSWLSLQCKMIAGADGSSATPDLLKAARLALREQRAVMRGQEPCDAADAPREVIAFPFQIDGKLLGSVAVEVPGRPEGQQRALMQLLQWGCTWLEFLLRQQDSTPKSQLATVLDLVGNSLEHDHFQTAAMALVTELARRLACERVSVGFRHGKHIRVHALSHSARFGEKTNLIRDLGMAMDEALDQETTILFPEHPVRPYGALPTAPGPAAPYVSRAHEQLSQQHGSHALCTIPLTANGRILGALTLERPARAPLDPKTVALCEHVGSLVGPILDLRRREDRWLGEKVREALRAELSKLVGPEHVGLKVGATLVVVLFAFLAFARGDYRVAATATLEGTVQRAVVAPLEGYVATAYARAGDLVREGEVLARLDDRDLQLEERRLEGERAQLLKEYREALADHDRAQVSILRAQLDQAEARLDLLEEQLARTRMVAPFAGIVVKGDLSQSLGSPVERGQVLFEVAPLDAYRIILEIDERDISDVSVGQRGRLLLSAMPGEVLPLHVEKITPVSTADEGRNYFRVEAGLEEPSELLRPGMQGIAKIEIDRRRLLWIWTHRLVDWLRLSTWSWWP